MSNWPQYVILGLLFLQLVIHLVKDGKNADTADRAGSVAASFVVFGIWFGLLWAGGFWVSVFS